jgi:hypothetical protein
MRTVTAAAEAAEASRRNAEPAAAAGAVQKKMCIISNFYDQKEGLLLRAAAESVRSSETFQ